MTAGPEQPGADSRPAARASGMPGHIPVLLHEVLAALDPKPGDVVLDCTAGLGGHAEAIVRVAGPRGIVVLCDQDGGNLRHAAERLRSIELAERPSRIETLLGSFAQAPRRLAEFLDAGRGADVVLADLGFSSNQMDDPERGFSFMRDGPLDMRLNRGKGGAGNGRGAEGGGSSGEEGGGGRSALTAAELVNTLPQRELAEILRDLGEEPAAHRIAEKIVASRKISPIQTTGQLAEIVRSVVPKRPGMSIDPATRTFQALRIAVNDELGALGMLLESISRAAMLNALHRRRGKTGEHRASSDPDERPGGARSSASGWLAPGARIGIISFHSLEDRLVKQVFGKLVSEGHAETTPARSKQPIGPSDEEVRDNPRSRSAKLRAIRLMS